MGVCTRKRVVYDISCKRFQFFVNVEALVSNFFKKYELTKEKVRVDQRKVRVDQRKSTS